MKKTRNITRWLEQHRTKTIQLTWARGWISSLQMEHDLANLATKLGLDCWLKYAGTDTITLLENGGLRSMVVEIKLGIPMVQTRFKVKTQHYFGATELPLILASTRLGFLTALTVTKQIAFIVGAKKLLLSIRKKCMICREEQAEPIRQRMGDIPSDQQHPEPGFRKISVDLAGPYLMKADVRRKIRQKRGWKSTNLGCSVRLKHILSSQAVPLQGLL